MENEKPTGISGGLSELFEILQDLTNGADNFEVNIPPAGETVPNQPDSPPINIQPQPVNDLGGDSTAGASKTTTGAVSKKNPKIAVLVQPDGKIRFRYSCEGRSAGSIPGINSTPDNRTYPTIEIVGWKGEVKLLVSLVTKDAPYRAHPHHLVGKDEHFEKGIFKKTLREGSHREVFKFLGIQCVKRKEIKEALDLREAQQVDPFKQGFAHKDQPASIDLNAVRLCFQAYLVLPGGGVRSLKPVVSEPIYDKKSINELNICNICCCSGKVTGGDQIILLCEKVAKDDIKVRFFEVNENGDELWEGFGEFTANDIHKQTAIVFRTPPYKHDEVDGKSKFYIQLVRPSDGATSSCREFEYYPNPVLEKRKRRSSDAINTAREAFLQAGNNLKLQNNFPEASFSTNPNYLHTTPKVETNLSPSPTHTFQTQPGCLSPMQRIATPELRYEWTPSSNSPHISNFNAITLQQQLEQQKQNQKQQEQFQQFQQYLNTLENGTNVFISNNTSPPYDNVNNNNTYTTLEPRNNNNNNIPHSPTNIYWDRTRNAPSTSGGSITPLSQQRNIGQNQTQAQQPMQSDLDRMTPSKQFAQLYIIPEVQQPLSSPNHYIVQQQQQQSPQPNIIVGTQLQQQQQPININTGTQINLNAGQPQQQLNLIAGTQLHQQQQQVNINTGTQPQQPQQLQQNFNAGTKQQLLQQQQQQQQQQQHQQQQLQQQQLQQQQPLQQNINPEQQQQHLVQPMTIQYQIETDGSNDADMNTNSGLIRYLCAQDIEMNP